MPEAGSILPEFCSTLVMKTPLHWGRQWASWVSTVLTQSSWTGLQTGTYKYKYNLLSYLKSNPRLQEVKEVGSLYLPRKSLETGGAVFRVQIFFAKIYWRLAGPEWAGGDTWEWRGYSDRWHWVSPDIAWCDTSQSSPHWNNQWSPGPSRGRTQWWRPPSRC